MNLVDTLMKPGCGHEYILVIVHYATWYTEAVPLQKAISKNITRKLILLFSTVGLLKDIFNGQGTPLLSKLMMDVCQLLQVKQLWTSVYYPQTDWLIE